MQLLSLSLVAGAIATEFGDVFNLNYEVPEIHLSEPPRLLELESGVRDWYTFDQMLALKRDGKTFMDVTDFPEEFFSVRSEVIYPKKLHYQDEIHELAGNLSKSNLEDTLTEFSSFFTRYCKSENGLESSLWLRDQVQGVVDLYDRSDVTVTLFDHDWQQKSLIAHIPGSKRPEEIVVVGAHQDSINLLMPNLLPAPGADDDGSGTVTIFEVFRVLLESGYVPENTLEFQWYSAEEVGLWGSQAIFKSYSEANKTVKAMLQQDMTGYSAGSTKDGHSDSLGVIVDYVDVGLTDFIKKVVDEYCDIPYAETECGYACSDHASASKYGYPSAFVIESAFDKSNKFIHTTEDTVDRLDFDHMLQHAKLTLGDAVELSQAKL